MSWSLMQERKSLLRKQFRSLMESAVIDFDESLLIQNAQSVISGDAWAVYNALPGEIDPSPIVDHFSEIKWAYPKINGDSLDFYFVKEKSDFVKNERWKMLEPDESKCTAVLPADLDGLVVPGVAFDRTGRRLGRGKGFYDRALKDCTQSKKVGLAFDCQIYDGELPIDKHDIGLDYILTDVELIDAKRGI